MRSFLFGLVVSSVVACTTEAPVESLRSDQVTTQAVPMTSGKFVGHYVVPAPTNMASAATFAMTEVQWTVSGGTATLHYDLPLGLVGGSLSISLGGAISSTTTSVQLASNVGTGTCTAQGSVITCGEQLANLGTLPISETVVQQTAVADNQPVASRTAIAASFSSDPIGTVDFDLNAPADDGGGGHHGGHGGGGGDSGGGGRH
jgi:uncharacterized membrane protein YgcG